MPLRRALTILASLVVVAMVAVTTYGLLDLAAGHTSEARAAYPDVRSIVVEDGNSDVRLVGAPAGTRLQVVARVREGLRSPERRVERLAGGELRLSSSCPAFLGGNCGVDYEVRVPAGTEVRARTTAGDLWASGLRGARPVVLQTAAGDIEARDVRAPRLRLQSSAGDVTAGEVRAPEVDVVTSAGDVTVELLTIPERLSARTSAGDVELGVPDAVYRVEADSNAGDVVADAVRRDPSATRLIEADTSAGDVLIEPR